MLGTKRRTRPLFEFQRPGPAARPSAAHKPDFTINVSKANQIQNRTPRRIEVKRKKLKTADTLFFIELLGTSDLASVTTMDASGKKLNAIDLSSMLELKSLVTADFSDNQLPLEPFSVIPNLTELDLSCNQLKSFDIESSDSLSPDKQAWGKLHTLNLSYNYSSHFIADLQFIPHLTTLNLAHNSIKELPSNLMHFTCLTDLNLTGNFLNTEQAFFSLATISSLQNLILDENKISSIPKIQFGFEGLTTISLRKNLMETDQDVSPLLVLESLISINIAGNPLVLRSRSLMKTRALFDQTNISLLIDDKPLKVQKRALPAQVKTIALDPLTLPSFSKKHQRALNKVRTNMRQAKNQKPKEEESNSITTITTAVDPDDDLFLTTVGTLNEIQPKVEEIPIDKEIENGEEEEEELKSIWSEVPVVAAQQRLALTPKRRPDFNLAFKRLEFLVGHPDVRLRPHESPSSEETKSPSPGPTAAESADHFVKRTTIAKPRKKIEVKQQLAARTEYTKTEVQQMLQSMADRLGAVEKDLGVTDEAGQTAVNVALDQKNFSALHKQYETIRAELINTLNA